MSITSIAIYACDRCGYRKEMPANHGPATGWGKIAYQEVGGPSRPGGLYLVTMTASDAKDLCPKCLGDLDDWWRMRMLEQ